MPTTFSEHSQMSLGLLRGTPRPIAIDFGVATVKVLQITGEESPTIVGAAWEDVPEEIRGDPAKRFEHQCAALPRLLKKAGVRGRRAVCSVSATSTLVQHVRVKKDAGVTASAQIDQLLMERTGRAPGQLISRTFDIVEQQSESGRRTEVLTVSMPRETVLAHMNALKNCRLEAVGVHGEHVALARLFAGLDGESSGGSNLYVDIGAATTKVIAARRGRATVARTLPVSSRDLALAAQKRGEASAPGLPGETTGGAAVAEAPPAAAVRDAMVALATEISLCIRQVEGLFEDARIERLIFTGGGSSSAEVVEEVSRCAGLAAFVADPLTLLGGDEAPAGRCGPSWAVAVGLCLSPTDI